MDLLIHTCGVAPSGSATLHLHKVRVILAQHFRPFSEPGSWRLRRQKFLCLDLLRLLLRSLHYAFGSLGKDTVPAPVTGGEEELVFGGGAEDEAFPVALPP